MIRENYGSRRWGLPAGDIEPDEQPHEAAVRETLEETGVTAAPRRLVGIYEFPAIGLVSYAFECAIVSGTPAVPPGGEIAAVTWLPPDEIPDPQTNVLEYALRDVAAGLYGCVRLALPPRALTALPPQSASPG